MCTCQKKIVDKQYKSTLDITLTRMCTKPGITELNSKMYCPRHARGIIAVKKNKEKYKNN